MRDQLLQSRALGFIETVCKISHDFTGAFQVIALAGFASSQRLNESILRSCLKRLAEQHPILRSRFVSGESGSLGLTLEDAPTVDLQFMSRAHRDSVEESLDRLLLTGFSDQSLWRVLVFETEISGRYQMIISAHHSIMDGLSMVKFVKDFLAILEGREKSHLEISSSLPPSVESFYQQRKSLTRFALESYLRKLYSALRPPIRVPFHEGIGKCTTAFRFESMESKPIIQASRKHGVTVTALIFGCLMRAILDEYKIPFGKAPTTTPSSPHRNHPKALGSLGCFMVPIEHSVPIGLASDVLTIAKTYQSMLHRDKDSLPYPNPYRANRFWRKILAKELAKRPTHFKYLCQISNLGIIDKELAQSMDSFQFFTSRSNGDVLMSLYLATTGTRLNMTFAFLVPQLSAKAGDAIIAGVHASLLTLSELNEASMPGPEERL